MNGVDSVYLNTYFYAEMAVAKRLLELSQEYMCTNMEGVANEIARMEKKTGVILAEEQRAAVLEAMSCGVLIITGGPGTGKTTTINTILRLLKDEGCEVVLAAPTGRAAKAHERSHRCRSPDHSPYAGKHLFGRRCPQTDL